MLRTKQITKYVVRSESKVPCFISMKVMPTVVCDCTARYYVTPATMWPACSWVQTKHPYQHQLNTGNHTEKLDKGRNAIWSSHFLGKMFLHPWESTVSCNSLRRSRVLLLHDDARSPSFHTTVNLSTLGTGTSFAIVDTVRLPLVPQNEEAPSNFILPSWWRHQSKG